MQISVQQALVIGAASPPSQAVIWGLVVIAAIVILGAGVWFVRRRLFHNQDAAETGEVWSLQHLRDLRATGQITEQEFDSLKAGVIESARKSRSTSEQPST